MAQKVITELQLRDNFTDTVNIPADDTIQTYRVTGAQIREFLTPLANNQSALIKNAGVSVSASAGAMTVALRQKDGSAALDTGINATEIAFRNLTLSGSGINIVPFDSTTEVTIPSGATLGFVDGDNAKVYVYAYYDGTNKGLAVSSKRLNESILHNLIEIDGTADSNAAYATAARTDAALRLLYFFQVNTITTAGTWTAPSLVSTAVESGMSRGLLRTIYFTSSGTYNKNPDADFIEVTVVGGGGGSGGADGQGASSSSAGNGGGGGGAAIKTIAAASLGDTETVTVGAGGTAGSASVAGGAGGTSSFGSHCSATGGAGGSTDSSGAGAISPFSGTGNFATGIDGDINIGGAVGGVGLRFVTLGLSGAGGDGPLGLGTGGNIVRGSGDGNAGKGYGAGASSGVTGNTSANSLGAVGAAGIVIVKEYKY